MKNRTAIIVLFLSVFLLVRIGVAILAEMPIEGNDSFSYHNYAVSVLQKPGWLTNPDFFGHYREPVYPLFLAVLYLIFGINNIVVVYIVQAVLSTLTCFLIYRFSLKIFEERVAFFALFWSGIYIFYLHYVRWLLREILVFFLLFLLFYCLYSYFKKQERMGRWFWGSIFVYTVLIHTDSRYVFYLPFLILLFLIFKPYKKAIGHYLIFTGMIVALMIPWTVRNYKAYDGLVIINTHNLDLRKKKDFSNKSINAVKVATAFNRISDCYENSDYPTEKERVQIKSGYVAPGRSEAEIEAIRRDVYPAKTFLGRKWFQFKEFWRPFRFKPAYRPCPDCRFVSWSFIHNLIFILGYGILLPFMILGITKMFKTKERYVWFLLFPIIVQNLLHVIQWGLTRYRNPIDAFVIILASNGVIAVYDFLKKRELALQK